jgi:hypothetical protein
LKPGSSGRRPTPFPGLRGPEKRPEVKSRKQVYSCKTETLSVPGKYQSYLDELEDFRKLKGRRESEETPGSPGFPETTTRKRIRRKKVEKMSDKKVEKVPEKMSDKKTEKVSDKAIEKMSDKKTEKVPDRVIEEVSDKRFENGPVLEAQVFLA